MELVNATSFPAAYTLGREPSGRESLVVAVKGTYQFPEPGTEPVLAAEQAALVMADTFDGEPGFSSPVYEADFAPVKRRADLLVVGSAHAPDGRPVERLRAGIRVGPVSKLLGVVGDRVWQAGAGGARASRPQPFATMPLSYCRAFGGNDTADPEPKNHSAYLQNPVGVGYHRVSLAGAIDGRPLPNLEEEKKPVTSPTGGYHPMSLGPVGRGWQPRLKFAGTYDEAWLKDVFPFLPADFDAAYYQAAPGDQQGAPLVGGEEVVLLNLTPEGRTAFRLPSVALPVTFFRKGGGHEAVEAQADTLVIEPDLRRFSITWRASLVLRRDLFEVPQILVGRRSRAWWIAHETGKDYFPSLGELVATRASEEAEEAAAAAGVAEGLEAEP